MMDRGIDCAPWPVRRLQTATRPPFFAEINPSNQLIARTLPMRATKIVVFEVSQSLEKHV